MNLVLLGYMASGKSKVGKALAKKIDYSFKDLDSVIEAEEKKSIKEVFADSGELYFRKKEKSCLENLLKQSTKTVIALGGGTPCYYNTMDNLVLNPDVVTVFLNVSIPVIVNRLENETQKRPLIAHINTNEQLTTFIGKHFFERSPFYNKAEVKIKADKTVEDIVEAIILQLF